MHVYVIQVIHYININIKSAGSRPYLTYTYVML